jgi:hypothetical protein
VTETDIDIGTKVDPSACTDAVIVALPCACPVTTALSPCAETPSTLESDEDHVTM